MLLKISLTHSMNCSGNFNSLNYRWNEERPDKIFDKEQSNIKKGKK
jgi:hypothetical protein